MIAELISVGTELLLECQISFRTVRRSRHSCLL